MLNFERNENRIMRIPGWLRMAALFLMAALLLCGCSRNTQKEKETREQAIGFLEQGAYSAAVARFNEALSYNSGKYGDLEIDILRYRGEAEILSGDYAAAAETYKLLEKEDEEKPEYLNLHVICLVRSGGKLAEAQELFEKAETADPGSAVHLEALYALGTALSKSEKPADVSAAQQLYARALNTNPTGELYNRMGMLAFEAGEISKAIDWFDKGILFLEKNGGENDRDVRASLEYNIAICYEYRQEYEKALERFRAYAAKYGTNEDLEHEIAFLESRL